MLGLVLLGTVLQIHARADHVLLPSPSVRLPLHATLANMERLPIALHLTQDLLPLNGSGTTSSSSARGQQPSKVVGSGAGYGPPLPAEGTPLMQLVSNMLYVPPREPTPAEAAQGGWTRGGKTEYDLVAVPLTNGNWQERWERMCTITASATEADLGALAGTAPTAQEERQRWEAEFWRSGGGFLRNEVNITRSGAFLIVFLVEWRHLAGRH